MRVDGGVPGGVLGTVEDLKGYLATVKWDDGGYSVLHSERLITHQQLKAWFKRGPKLYKKA